MTATSRGSKRFLALILIVSALVGCVHKSPLQTGFKALEGTSAAFLATYSTLSDLHLAGIISDDDWNHKIMPLHDKGKAAIDAAWAGLHAYSVSQSPDDLAKYQALYADAEAILSDFKKLVVR